VIETLIDARKSRRKIIELLTKQQLEDSCCAEKLKEVALSGKRKLLELIGTWLISFEPDKEYNDTDRDIFAAIGTDVSLEGWLSLQRREVALNVKEMEARQVEDGLYKVYERVAPIGFISVWLSNGAEKAKAERVRQDYRGAKDIRESIGRDVFAVREEIRKAIARFLRNAITPQSVEILANKSRVSGELASLIQQVEENGLSVWASHAQRQILSLSELEQEAARLLCVYSTTKANQRNQTALSANAGEK
jgi:hypothetical protein